MEGEVRFLILRADISFLRDRTDWSYHLRPVFFMGAFFSKFDHLFGGAEEDVSKGGDKVIYIWVGELMAVFEEFNL